MDSPFSWVLESVADTLPAALREQFTAADAQYAVVLTGRVERVWRRHGWLRPFFSLLARADILFPETGCDVPASLTITRHLDRHGDPCQRWCRVFAFATLRRFNATMAYDRETGHVVERLGPAGILQVPWTIRFDAPGRLLILAERVEFCLGDWHLRLPAWLGLGVRAVEEADAAYNDLIRIDIVISHRLLGPVFGYNGEFRLERRPIAGTVP